MNTHGGDGEGEGGAEEGEVEGGGDVRGGENLLGHSRHDLGGARLGGGHHGTWGGRSGREMGWLSDRRERGGYLDRARASVAIEPPGRPAIAWGRADRRSRRRRANSRTTARTGARIALGADGPAARRGRHRTDRERDRRDDEGRTRTNGDATGATFLATPTGPTVALADTFTARAERALVARAAGATLMAETVETWAMAILKLVWC